MKKNVFHRFAFAIGLVLISVVIGLAPRGAVLAAADTPCGKAGGTCINTDDCDAKKTAAPETSCEASLCYNILVPATWAQDCYIPPPPKPPAAAATTGTGSTTKLENPLGADATLYTIVSRVISTFLGLVGALALLVFVWAGITWMTAASSDRVQKAKEMMKTAVIGIALIAFSYAIASKFIQLFAGS